MHFSHWSDELRKVPQTHEVQLPTSLSRHLLQLGAHRLHKPDSVSFTNFLLQAVQSQSVQPGEQSSTYPSTTLTAIVSLFLLLSRACCPLISVAFRNLLLTIFVAFVPLTLVVTVTFLTLSVMRKALPSSSSTILAEPNSVELEFKAVRFF